MFELLLMSALLIIGFSQLLPENPTQGERNGHERKNSKTHR